MNVQLQDVNVELARSLETFRDNFKDLKLQHAVETGQLEFVLLACLAKHLIFDRSCAAPLSFDRYSEFGI